MEEICHWRSENGDSCRRADLYQAFDTGVQMEDLIGEFCISTVLPFCLLLFLPLLILPHLTPLLSRRSYEQFVEKEQNLGSRTDF